MLVGWPVAVKLKLPAEPVSNVVVDAPVKLGASLTVRMKDCDASVPTPLEALKVRL